MAKERWNLTQSQWEKIEPLLPKLKKSKRGGRPWANSRKAFEGILWIYKTGAPWADLPKQYPSPSTCRRRLKLWEQHNVWLDAWRTFLAELDQRRQLDWSEAFVYGSFTPAKKGANASAFDVFLCVSQLVFYLLRQSAVLHHVNALVAENKRDHYVPVARHHINDVAFPVL
jgi:transposase